MSPQEILTRINDQVPDQSVDPTRLTPLKIAGFLAMCGDALVKFIQAAQANMERDRVILSQRKVEHIESIFKELSDNFFPMAHTTAPLSHLRIHKEAEIRQIGEMLYEAEAISKQTHVRILQIKETYNNVSDW